MSDRMRTIPFAGLLSWISEEYKRERSIFSIPSAKFFQVNREGEGRVGAGLQQLPLGPAAGPHTQLAQNLAAAYLTGGRYFELKTVQVLDRLTFPKPCINAMDECYNTEWSTELAIGEALEEYIKGWLLLHLLGKELFGSNQRAFTFNMSVGYDLQGIRSTKVDRFMEGLKDASITKIFKDCKAILSEKCNLFGHLDQAFIDSISPQICRSISLSTMHGCPPQEIEEICRYLLCEKQLDTHVKLNPTLLGYRFVRETLNRMGYDYIALKEETFTADLGFDEAVPLIERLIALGEKEGREFGVKVSNTLPVTITRGELPGEEMYLSGKPLYALTINLACKLAEKFRDKLRISYSGGADRNNIARIIETGIKPITVVSTLLRPRGYHRLRQLAEIVSEETESGPETIDPGKLKKIAAEALIEPVYQKDRQKKDRIKKLGGLPIFDCSAGCTICSDVCPNRANVGIKILNPEEKGMQQERQILHIDGTCNECGNCATFCPYGGKPYRDKLTLYWYEEDFTNSENEGFLISRLNSGEKIKIRFGGSISEMDLTALGSKTTTFGDPAALLMIRTILESYRYLFVS